MKPHLFDIHSHLNFSDFDHVKSTNVDHGAGSDREEVINRMLDAGVWTIIVGSDLESSKKAVEIAQKYDEGVYAAAGLHPTEHLEAKSPSEMRELAKNPKVVAIGECGLEYFRIKDKKEKERQKEIFKQQIELAVELDKPLVVHCRDAHEDVIEIISNFKSQKSNLRGHIHFFSGNLEQAKKYIELGFLISFTGVITFARDYDEVIKNIPLEKIMIETDAPFVAPVPYRGKRNEPAYVAEVAKKIAEIKNISVEDVARVTTQNAFKLFGVN